jgi:hypothetical protein
MAQEYYITGNTANEFFISGVLIPKNQYSIQEKAMGKKLYSKVSSAQLDVLRLSGTFKELERTRKIVITQDLPADKTGQEERLSRVKKDKDELQRKVNSLENENLILRNQLEEVKASLNNTPNPESVDPPPADNSDPPPAEPENEPKKRRKRSLEGVLTED